MIPPPTLGNSEDPSTHDSKLKSCMEGCWGLSRGASHAGGAASYHGLRGSNRARHLLRAPEGRPTMGMSGAGRWGGRRPCSRRLCRRTCSSAPPSRALPRPLSRLVDRDPGCAAASAAARQPSAAPELFLSNLTSAPRPLEEVELVDGGTFCAHVGPGPPSTGVEARAATCRPRGRPSRRGGQPKSPAVWAAGAPSRP